ncbi:MAG: hypothetical protein CVV02_00030 [Firmicutes bacterium HGW-Firmicutes-7]|nr:MAG: hypothetical protein CVV02_00030 [Firmicutes bacterium HGW-Firmicutes-7]
MVTKTYAQINEKIKNGVAVVVTAEEVLDIIEEKGIEGATEYVDVVTTATFGPMCSSGAFLNLGHSDPAIRMEKVKLNNVNAYAGLAAVDAYIGATQESDDRGYEYGGAHVICDLIDGKQVHLQATGKGTDCYPRKSIDTYITKDSINEAYIYNPRNCYQNYNAAINTSSKRLFTYMGILNPNSSVVTYSTSGQLSPLLNDPLYRTIGIGTRIFIGGGVGYVAWKGTQFKSGVERDEKDLPQVPAGTLALVGDLKQMSTKYIQPAVFERYGTSMFVGIGIPIPILDENIMRHVAVKDEDIFTNVVDYSVFEGPKPVLARVSYKDLRSGEIEVQGKRVRTAPLSSLHKAREIAGELKAWIEKGEFFIQEPVDQFQTDCTLNGLKIVKKEG